MNSNYNVSNVNMMNKKSMKNAVICIGMHPEGGFVAWPNGKTSRITHDQSPTVGKCVNRKGFVAWPVKE